MAILLAAVMIPGTAVTACNSNSSPKPTGTTGVMAAARRPKASCLPAATARTLAQLTSVFDIPPRQRFKLLDVAIATCGPWPKLVHKAVKIFRPKDPEERSVLLGGTPLYRREDYNKAVEKLCPGYEKAYTKHKKQLRTAAGRTALLNARYKACRVAKRGVVTKKELEKSDALAVIGMLINDQLIKRGVGAPVARTIGRLMLTEHPLMQTVWENKLKLLQSSSATELQWVLSVTISSKAIICSSEIANVKNGRVDANAKRDGPHGFFIDPLFKKLKEESRKRRASAAQGGSAFHGDLLLLVDARTSFRLLAEVLYTAYQAELNQIQLVVKHPSGRLAVILIPRPLLMKHLLLGRPRAKPWPFPVVVQRKKAFEVQHGTPVVNKRFPYGPGAAYKARAQVVAYLRKTAPQSTAAPYRGTIRVGMYPQAPVAELVKTLDALRTQSAPATSKPSTGGCSFTYDRRKATWTLATAARPYCRYPFPVIALLSK